MAETPHTSSLTPASSAVAPALIRVIDVGGLMVSALCAVHCAATPFLLLALPVLGWQEMETPLRLTAVTIALLAVGGGALLHRNVSVVVPLLLGIALIGVASALHGSLVLDAVVSVAASAALMRAHWLNTRACARSGHDCAPAQKLAALPWTQDRDTAP